jgi:hypothetical protein
LPRQLILMKEKSRCSILFHLLVPGGVVAEIRNRRSGLLLTCGDGQTRIHVPIQGPKLA